MSAIKRYIEDIGTHIHTGNRLELEDLLGSWSHEDQVNILLEGISWAAMGSESCECLAHKLKAYADNHEECSHDYGVEKGISFCLNCGEFEDFLATMEEGN